eukprot:5317525-Pleurochrysis_carterae.AAC.1
MCCDDLGGGCGEASFAKPRTANCACTYTWVWGATATPPPAIECEVRHAVQWPHHVCQCAVREIVNVHLKVARCELRCALAHLALPLG